MVHDTRGGEAVGPGENNDQRIKGTNPKEEGDDGQNDGERNSKKRREKSANDWGANA